MSIRNFDLDPRTLARLPVLKGSAASSALVAYERIDRTVVAFLREHSITMLRLALAVVFIWFGALKVIDRSPVYQLVADPLRSCRAPSSCRRSACWRSRSASGS